MIGSASPESARPIPGFLHPLRLFLRWVRFVLIKYQSLGKDIRVGRGTYFGAKCIVHPPEFCVVADRVSIGREFFLQVNCTIGEDTLISSRVSMVGNDHDFSDRKKTVYSGKRLPPCKVVVGRDCLVGHGVTVVGNIHIGDGVIVGAGSVVTKDLPEYTICVGNPAKPIKGRYDCK
ncbi:acyltransferase [Dechloromonas sp. TW-R-39-2]|uniref:acyltransferase n=1 Tax=Dechloromonas sp. TW-R-39-2 TaxID=2654218 RepID=UPI00193CE4D2|nr:acyltransferase [Dechloromonas sp. TW-R-39-2]QRM18683.1 acyltransferase [Dechloromonas sp. TW-R-39-2]